jgi:hypothetical protein
MDSNVFGGVTTKLVDLLSLEEQIKFKLVDPEVILKNQFAKPNSHSNVNSKLKKYIERPTSQFDIYRF